MGDPSFEVCFIPGKLWFTWTPYALSSQTGVGIIHFVGVFQRFPQPGVPLIYRVPIAEFAFHREEVNDPFAYCRYRG